MKNASANGITVQRRSAKEFVTDQRFIILICIIGMAIFCTLLNNNFLTPKNIVAIFQQVAVVGLLTMGMAMILLSGGVDLSIGNIMILAGCTMAVLIVGPEATTASGTALEGVEQSARNAQGLTSVPVAIVIGLGVAALCGWVNGLIISKSKCIPLIISLGMSQAYYGIALLITEGRFMSFKLAFEPLRLMKIGELVPITLLMFLALVFLAYILVNRTKFGRRIVAIGGNEENARLSGIPVDKYKILTYTISGIYCGVASIIYASRLDAITAGGGAGYELNALTGAIIGGVTFDGGKGTIIGAFLGCMFMGVLNNVMNVLGASPALQAMIAGGVIVVAVILSNIENLKSK